MACPLCQVPQQPAVDGAKSQFAALGSLPRPGDIIQQPGNFAGGKIGIQQQPCLATDHSFTALLDKLAADVCSAAILPDNGIVYRLAGVAIPDHCGFPLVGNTYGGNLVGIYAGICDCLPSGIQTGLPDIHGVVFNPAGVGEVLLKFTLGLFNNGKIAIKEDGPRRGGSLVHCQYKFLFFCTHLGPSIFLKVDYLDLGIRTTSVPL